ncbi:hypothetical protein EFV37_35615 (plasmid) [Mesorhizobium loti]|uniref:Uncharacterized protein n=1 Tax=Mesorhizobium jarvisii TaxID=1777867 RepID=A0A6M7TS71_9HYPH|nr:hypothetical protein EB229_35610 [Mesorhizobium jarvisii]QKD13504.1 hypothetical protein EFV37_35615 [Mesorhizobium loti]RJT29391.1 hypothetical protein D3242_29450 [Mesorhizobium jarvisii]
MKTAILSASALCLLVPSVASADAIVVQTIDITDTHWNNDRVVIYREGHRLHHRRHGDIAFFDHGRRHHRSDTVVIRSPMDRSHHRHRHVVIQQDENGGY